MSRRKELTQSSNSFVDGECLVPAALQAVTDEEINGIPARMKKPHYRCCSRAVDYQVALTLSAYLVFDILHSAS